MCLYNHTFHVDDPLSVESVAFSKRRKYGDVGAQALFREMHSFALRAPALMAEPAATDDMPCFVLT